MNATELQALRDIRQQLDDALEKAMENYLNQPPDQPICPPLEDLSLLLFLPLYDLPTL